MCRLTCSAKQLYIFCLGWTAYASTYLLRKPIGVVKADLHSDFGVSTTYLGWLDAALVLPYALVQMLFGSVGDKFGPRRTYGACLFLSGLSMVTFGHQHVFFMLLVLLLLNGSAQALCWPSGSKIIASWFQGTDKNVVYGLYGTSAFAGGVLGTSLSVYLLAHYGGWRSCFLLPSAVVMVLSVFVYLSFHEASEGSGQKIPLPETASGSSSLSRSFGSWMKMWKIPLVAEVSVCVFCLKLVRYCLYFWLPFYMHEQVAFSKAEAGMFSVVFDVGGIVGSAGVGVFINRLFSGRPIPGCAVSTVLSTMMLFFFATTVSHGVKVNTLFMFMAGAYNCGPDTILIGLVPTDLGERDGKNAGAAVTGLVNGFASLGSVVQGPVVGNVVQRFGWSAMLPFTVVVSGVGSVVLVRAALIERRTPRRQSADPDPV